MPREPDDLDEPDLRPPVVMEAKGYVYTSECANFHQMGELFNRTNITHCAGGRMSEAQACCRRRMIYLRIED
jgi:hypothetical protein